MTLTDQRPIRLLFLLLAGLLFLVSVATAIGAVVQKPPAIFVAMFEPSVMGAAFFLHRLGIGALRSGRALALLCIAGAVGASTVFGYLAVNGELMGMRLTGWLIGRLGLAGLLVAIAGAEVLLRDARVSVRRFAIGVGLLVPVVGIGAASQVAGVRSAFDGLGALAQILAVVGLFFLLLGMVCAAAHYLITAFIAGVLAAEKREDAGAAR